MEGCLEKGRGEGGTESKGGRKFILGNISQKKKKKQKT